MATNTKKILEEDFTKNPRATTQADVDAQDSRTRLWQSLGYTYGNQIKESDKSYDKAYSQADRQAIARGMQRSSYNGQTLANLANQKIEAQNNIRAAQIADYQNRIGEIEAQERQEAFQREQFEYQKAQDALAQQNWQAQMDYQQSRDAVSDAFNEKQWQAQQEQWKQQFDYDKMSTEQKLNYETVMYALQNGKDISDDMLAKAGISRDDFNSMKAVAASSGGGYSSSSRSSSDSTTPNDSDVNAALGSSPNLKYIAGVASTIAAGFKSGASNSVGKDKVGTTSTSAISSAAQKEIGAAKSAGEAEALMKKYGYIK